MNYIEQGIKVGDKVWTIQDGDTEIAEVDIKASHPITTKSGYWYMADGKTSPMHASPALFWSKPYDTIPEKPEPPKYQWIWRKKGRDFGICLHIHGLPKKISQRRLGALDQKITTS